MGKDGGNGSCCAFKPFWKSYYLFYVPKSELKALENVVPNTGSE